MVCKTHGVPPRKAVDAFTVGSLQDNFLGIPGVASTSSQRTTPKYSEHYDICNPDLYLEDQKFQGQSFGRTHAETDVGVNSGFTEVRWQKHSHQHLSAKIK